MLHRLELKVTKFHLHLAFQQSGQKHFALMPLRYVKMFAAISIEDT